MKQLTLIVLFLFSAHTITAQKQDRREHIKSLKIAFLTEKLELSATEAQNFWPLYNEYEETYHKLRKSSYRQRKNSNPEGLTEAEANTLLNEMMEIEDEKQRLKQDFIENLQEVISAKKIIMLKQAEDDFNRKMFEEYKRRKQEREKNP